MLQRTANTAARPSATAARPLARTGGQLELDHLGTPLHTVTFVVVDLETDGGAPTDAGITEFGAVKIRGGETLGEFQSLVRSPNPLPPFISALTGISNAMLANAPALEVVLPSFLNFAAGTVLVAHNATYDVGFLKGACARLGLIWPAPTVIDTATLARAVLTNDEVPNRKLATLAGFFRSSTTPNHRALSDARATVEVLHGLMERVGNLGVNTLEELTALRTRVPETRRRKRGLAEGLPDRPGVYVFEDAAGTALYVGTSRSIRTRVRNYFTAAETRPRMSEMVGLAERVVAVECATPLEAQIRELRIIAAREPRYNRRSTRPQRAVWLKLTVERYPRISLVSKVRSDTPAGAAYIGPYLSRRTAQAACEAIAEALPLRSCTTSLGSTPKGTACVLADLGRCPAPCIGRVTEAQYAQGVAAARHALTANPEPVVTAIMARIAGLSSNRRYEDAGAWRDRVTHLLRGIDEATHGYHLGRIPHIMAAAPGDRGDWQVHVIRFGRLASAGVVPAGEAPSPYLAQITAAAEHVDPPAAPATAALPEESAILWRWLFGPEVRLIDLMGDHPLALPRTSAGRFRSQFTLNLREPHPPP